MSSKPQSTAKEAVIEIAGAIARVTAGAAGTLFTSPLVGPILNELVSFVIPNQRLDRLQRYAQVLERRLEYIEKDRLQSRLDDPEIIDIFEDSCFQAARALTDDRIEQIASVVATGLSAEELKTAETKRMLWLLGQLVDQEVIILRAKLARTDAQKKSDAEFLRLHASVLLPDPTRENGPVEMTEDKAILFSYRQHLLDLGLLQKKYERQRPAPIPDIDPKTGEPWVASIEVTMLGRMLLKYLGIQPDWHY